jgi:hypothetical protein
VEVHPQEASPLANHSDCGSAGFPTCECRDLSVRPPNGQSWGRLVRPVSPSPSVAVK